MSGKEITIGDIELLDAYIKDNINDLDILCLRATTSKKKNQRHRMQVHFSHAELTKRISDTNIALHFYIEVGKRKIYETINMKYDTRYNRKSDEPMYLEIYDQLKKYTTLHMWLFHNLPNNAVSISVITKAAFDGYISFMASQMLIDNMKFLPNIRNL